MQITALTPQQTGLSSLLPQTSQADARGLKLGRYSEKAETTPVLAAKSSGTTSDTFAAEILRRLQDAQSASNAGSLIDSGAAGDLQTSLSDAIDAIREKHGDAAATAVMGIIVKGVGDGSGGEDAVGNALVSSLKFIDRNFGIAAGDAAIANFNGALNDAVNGYFQNGHNELFYASDGTGTTDTLQSTLASAIDDVTQRFGDATAKAVSDILTASLEETGADRKGLGTALSAADAYLQGQYGADAGIDPGVLPGVDAPLAKGSVLDLAV
ncbi:MAG: hypothetical protein AB7D37_20600 [Desulfovibrio sp.]